MNPIKRLIHEVHRRSLWQVVAIYLVGSFGALEAVDFLTENAGLPDWVPSLALVLLVIGLPIVTATAFIQEGLPGRDAVRPGASTRHPGPPTGDAPGSETDSHGGDRTATTSAHGSPEFLPDPGAPPPVNLAAGTGSLDRRSTRPPLYKRVITWRFALLGGVAAFALLGVAVAGYFAMRVAGIGPVASLQAQGLFDEREAIVLADFRNATTDSLLGGVVTEALRVDLVQSPVLRVLDPSEVAATLQRMELPADVAITSDVAREVAARQGFKAVLAGEIGSLGSGYVVTATLRGATDGRSYAAFRVTAEDDSELVRAVDKLSQDIREKAGEGLRSIKADPPLAQVTTSSLAALRKYAEAEALQRHGAPASEALPLLVEAVAADSGFAMAWRKIAVLLNNSGGSRTRAIQAATRAWQYRDRLTDIERYLAIAFYNSVVVGDEDEAIRAYENALAIEPDNTVALNNAGVNYMRQDRWAQAEDRFRRMVDGGTDLVLPYTNIVITQIAQNRLDDARASLELANARYPGNSMERYLGALLELRSGNPEAADSAILAGRRPGAVVRAAPMQAMLTSIDALSGRKRAALAHAEDFIEIQQEQDGPAGELRARLQLATRLATAELENADAARIEAMLSASDWPSMEPVARPYAEAVRALADADARERAEQLIAEWERDVPVDVRGADFAALRRLYLALLDRADGNAAAAAEGIEQARRELRCIRCLRSELATTYQQLDRTDDAITVWRSIVEERSGSNTDPWEFPLALERLGQLYDATGDRDNAIGFYSRFAELWKDADADLQPRVERAKSRVAALVAERG